MQRVSILLIVLTTAVACSDQGNTHRITKGTETKASPRQTLSPLILSILPVESAGSIYEKFIPLKYHLENTLKRPVTIKIAKDYDTAIRELGTGQVDIACFDPATYCEVRARYRGNVIPLVRTVAKEGATSRSVLVAKGNSGIGKVVEVKGRRLALGSRQSSFSYLIPLAMLHDVGIGIQDFASVDYLQQEDSVALSVLIGNHDVGALSEYVAKKYTDDGLVIIKSSEAIPQFVLCSSRKLPPDMREFIIKDLVSLSHGQGLPAVDERIGGFVAAEDRDFDVVRAMIKELTGRNYIEYGPKTIKVAVLPFYSTITLYDRYEPLMRYLSRGTGYEFKLIIPRDFEDFMEVVKSGTVHFSYQNPYIFSLIDNEMDIRPLVTTIGEDGPPGDGMEGEDSFRGVIITRADSTIRHISGLKDKKVLITSPKSAGGYLSQKIFLLRNGIDAERDLRIVDAKKQENVILGVYRGEADAGFVRESALLVWKDAVDMKKIRVIARTEPLPNWPFALCRKTDPSLVKAVTRLLTELHDRQVLGAARIRGFKKAGEAEFEVLKNY
jgi:phosphate/phosphite/phosphonate ABC transporter binding protein